MKNKCIEKGLKSWAVFSLVCVLGIILFLFGYIFFQGADTISMEFLFESPKGAVLGEEGGIFPAIIGSFAFTGIAVLFGGSMAICVCVYLVFYCKKTWISNIVHSAISCISGIPSIVLGLFSYSFFVKELSWGRCILSAGAALAIMIMPFIEVRVEKAFYEIPKQVIEASRSLGCSRRYTLFKIVFPSCQGEIISALLLGACFAMGATAPLIFTGAVAYAALPHSLFAPAMALPMHLYLLVAQGATSLPMAYGTSLVMMVILLICHFIAVIHLKRRKIQWTMH